MLRKEDFVNAALAGMVWGFRLDGPPVSTRGIGRDLARHDRSGAFGLAPGFDACADQHVAPQPTLDGRTAIPAGIYAQAADRDYGLFADIAMARLVAIVAAVLASHLFFAVVLQLSA